MARVTVEDCIDKVANRFELVVLAAHRAREISAGDPITVDRDNDKNPVVALREIAEETITAEALREAAIGELQSHNEGDEPEEDTKRRLIDKDSPDAPAEDDMSEENMLRALMEAQSPS